MADVLPRYGCAVWTAPDGYAAVLAYQRLRAGIGVVLLDVLMPGWDGPQTLHALRAIDPAVRVVLMTGDPVPYADGDLALLEAAVVRKPFASLTTLAAVLRQIAKPQVCRYIPMPASPAQDVSSRTRVMAALSGPPPVSNPVPATSTRDSQSGPTPLPLRMFG